MDAHPDPYLRRFLADTLALWQIEGAVESGEAPVVAMVRAAKGATIWIERADSGPFRWLVRWRSASEAAGGPREKHPRGCASLLGVLGAMRSALGIDRGSALRIAPAPMEQ